MGRYIVLFLMMLITSGCSGVMHSGSPQGLVSFDELRDNPGALVGKTVYVEGRIVSVTPAPGVVELEVVECGLDIEGVPEKGRFLATTETMADQGGYKPGQNVAIDGKVKGTETRSVQGMPFTYPVVSVQRISVQRYTTCTSRKWDFGPACCGIGQF